MESTKIHFGLVLVAERRHCESTTNDSSFNIYDSSKKTNLFVNDKFKSFFSYKQTDKGILLNAKFLEIADSYQ